MDEPGGVSDPLGHLGDNGCSRGIGCGDPYLSWRLAACLWSTEYLAMCCNSSPKC